MSVYTMQTILCSFISIYVAMYVNTPESIALVFQIRRKQSLDTSCSRKNRITQILKNLRIFIFYYY